MVKLHRMNAGSHLLSAFGIRPKGLWKLKFPSLKSGALMLFLVIGLQSNSMKGQDSAQEVLKYRPELHGYLKNFPMVVVAPGFDAVQQADNILHKRLNFRWRLNPHWEIQAAQRTRLFWGQSSENPFFRDFLDVDLNGPADLSRVLFSEQKLLLHTITDRAFVDYTRGKWQVRVGRQRINWGINTVSNPNDLFNNYSFFDFDYEERPGVDALRVNWFRTSLSRLELAIAPGRDVLVPGSKMSMRESVAAVLWGFNRKGYDWQLVSGYFRNRLAVGGGWAGSIGAAGFKGELSWFYDLEKTPGLERGNVVVALSADYRFGNGLFWINEVVYNQQRGGGVAPILLIRPLRADNLSFSDWSVLSTVSYPIGLRHSLNLAGFYYPTEEAVFFSPSYSFSAAQNLDLTVLGQYFLAGDNSLFANAGSTLALLLKWSF